MKTAKTRYFIYKLYLTAKLPSFYYLYWINGERVFTYTMSGNIKLVTSGEAEDFFKYNAFEEISEEEAALIS